MISHKSISCVLTFSNFALLLIVVLSPCWFAYYAHVDLYYMGLWTICSEKFICRLVKDVEAYMIICRVLFMLGLFTSVTSLLWVWLVEKKQVRGCPLLCPPQALMASILSFAAGLVMLVAMLIFELKINDKTSTVHQKKWAFYLSYIVMILWFFIGLYNLVCYKYSHWEARGYTGNLSSSKTQQEQLQMALEQMEQNPG